METRSSEAPETGGEPAEQLAAADGLFRQRKYAEALPAYRAAAEAAEAAGDRSLQAEALAQVARMHSLLGDLEAGRTWLERALALADPGLPKGYTRAVGVRGIFEREDGNKEQALATFAVLYDYARERDLPRRAVDAAHHAAIVAPTEEQIAWAERGIAAAGATGDEGWLAVLWNNLGATHEDRGDWAAAAEAYARAKHYHDRTGGRKQKLAAAWALGRARLRAGQQEEAAPLLEGALAEARRWSAEPEGGSEAAEWLGWTLAGHGELRLRQGAAVEALEELEAGRERLVAAGIEQWWPAGLADLDAVIAEAKQAAAR